MTTRLLDATRSIFPPAPADLGERLGTGERGPDGFGQPVGHLLGELEIEVKGRGRGLAEGLLDSGIRHRRLVTMGALDRHARGEGIHGSGEFFAEKIVGRVLDPAPVDGAEDVTARAVREDNALGQKRRLHGLHGGSQAPAEGMADRRRDVALKARDPKPDPGGVAGSLTARDEQTQKQTLFQEPARSPHLEI
jgi:hypothetical protein